MYEQFYGFAERPFNVTPDTKYFFASEKHEEALSSLLYAIQYRKGFAVITGEIGSGKTTIWHALLNKLERGTKIALITNTHLTPKQMMCAVLEDLGIFFQEKWPKRKLLTALNHYLIEQISLGFNVILVIDEAQNLGLKALEEVRMISNLETEKEKLIQILLMGQPELREMLALKQFEQLRQRIAVSYHIYPLSKEETEQYIKHRLKIAGADGGNFFSLEALKQIYISSGGIPRKINTLCDHALLTGFIRENAHIGPEIIEEVVQEISDVAFRDERITTVV